MAKDNFLGGFIGTSGGSIKSGITSITSGSYNIGDVSKMRQVNSWMEYKGDVGVGTYINRSTSSSGTITIPAGVDYVFVSLSAGGGSGAHDNDCRNQTPGGSGGAAKALVSLMTLGTNTLTYSLGAGGGGVGGNDASGSPGGGSNITIGNFSLTCNGGGGGFNYTNSGTGPPGNASISGPYTLYSTSSVFSSPAFTDLTNVPNGSQYTYLSIPTSSPGSGARCGEGGSSSPGDNGFLYIRYGKGINASTTLTPGQDPPITGPTQAYTPNY